MPLDLANLGLNTMQRSIVTPAPMSLSQINQAAANTAGQQIENKAVAYNLEKKQLTDAEEYDKATAEREITQRYLAQPKPDYGAAALAAFNQGYDDLGHQYLDKKNAAEKYLQDIDTFNRKRRLDDLTFSVGALETIDPQDSGKWGEVVGHLRNSGIAIPMPEQYDPKWFDAMHKAIDQLSGQADKMDYLKTQNIGKNEPAKTLSDPYAEGTNEYAMSKYIAENNIPPSQWRSMFTGLGITSAAKPRVFNTILKINPDYDWKETEEDYKTNIIKAGKEGALSPDIIAKEAQKTHATTMAQLQPDVQTEKVEQQARGQAAKTLNNQRQAAQRAISTFEDAKNQYGSYENIPDWMYRDLASDYAKILVSTGQIAEGSVDKVMQMSAKGEIVKLWNFATGDTKTTAPNKVLALMHDRIKALNTDLNKQYYNQTTGKNIPVNSNPETDPYRTDVADETDEADEYGFTIGEKKFSKKYGRELEYVGGGKWR